MEKKEPQSYGSQSEWVTGETGQKVNDPGSEPSEQHAGFYDAKREAESSGPNQGGRISPTQLAENAQLASPNPPRRDQPVTSVTDQTSGAKRDGYFKRRDYDDAAAAITTPAPAATRR